jgi:hypothetical protein
MMGMMTEATNPEPPDDGSPLPPLDEPEAATTPERAELRRKFVRRAKRGTKARRPAARSSSASSARRSPAKPKAESAGAERAETLEEIRSHVVQAQVAVGAALSMTPLQVTAATMANRAETGADVLIKIAERNEAVYAALQALVVYGVWAQLATLLASWAVAVGVDVGRIAGDSWLAQRVIGEEVAIVEEVQRERAAADAAVGDATASAFDRWAAPRQVA